MKRAQLILATALLASAGLAYGCAESGPDNINLISTASNNPTGGDGGSGGEAGAGGEMQEPGAYEMYVDTVHDELVAQCGVCHSAGVVGAPIFLNDEGADAAYALLENYNGLINHPDSSTLVLKDEHAGPAMSSALKANAVAWLTLEASERGLEPGPGDPPKETVDDALTAFAACMRLDVWDGMGMGLVPLNQTQGMGPCLGCHNTGIGGLFLDTDSELNYLQTKANKYHLLKYVRPIFDQATGDFDRLAVATRLWDKGQETSPVEPSHPKYVFLPENQQAVMGFVQHTLDAIENETCDEPYLPPGP